MCVVTYKKRIHFTVIYNLTVKSRQKTTGGREEGLNFGKHRVLSSPPGTFSPFSWPLKPGISMLGDRMTEHKRLVQRPLGWPGSKTGFP